MSGTFPTEPAPATVSLSGNQPTSVGFSESGKRQSRILGGHLWKAKFSWSRMTRDMLSPIFAFAIRQRGRYGTFQIVLPNYALPQGTMSGSPIVGAVALADADSFTHVSAGSLTYKAGDVIKFASHAKVYMVTQDFNSGAGSATCYITPPLIEALSIGEAVTYENVPFTMSLDDDIIDWKGSAPNMAIISTNMTESLL